MKQKEKAVLPNEDEARGINILVQLHDIRNHIFWRRIILLIILKIDTE